jgi:alpha-galactosidase
MRLIAAVVLFFAVSCTALAASTPGAKTFANRNIEVILLQRSGLEIRARAAEGEKWRLLSTASDLGGVITEGSHRARFQVSPEIPVRTDSVHTSFGNCTRYIITGRDDDASLQLEMRILVPDDFPDVVICEESVRNTSAEKLVLDEFTTPEFLNDAVDFGADSAFNFWSFQGGSYPERYDWIFPLTDHYYRKNYQGMNAPDYGGGIPVIDLWTKFQGIAFASVATEPQLISLPVKVTTSGSVSVLIADSVTHSLEPGHSLDMVPFAIIVHHGDFYNGLRTYSRLMQAQGFSFPEAPKSAYQPEWCAWGYGRNFNKAEILKSLPEAKRLGFGWVTIDDGWQNNLGDWEPNPDKFPGGEKDFEAFIDSIHSYGLKVRLWWCPFAAQDSAYSAKAYPERMKEYGMGIQSKLALEHPDWFILDKEGRRVQVSWWNAYLLCPALPQVRAYYSAFATKAITKWHIDGFKIDGQNLNEVPRCYNKEHDHTSPLESSRAVPLFFKDIYDTATRLRPGFLIQLCPCGTNFSIYNLPFVNQTVASDPEDSWQVRLKGKTFRALYGGNEAYSGDHVELTNRTWNDSLQTFVPHGLEDFASTLAVGGIPASKFTIPGVKQEDSTLELTGSKYNYYRRWLDVYENEKMSEGRYLNLYDIAFDKPETHVIRKGDSFYYSFFTPKHFDGTVQLRGLSAGLYKAYDLYSGKLIEQFSSKDPYLAINFDRYLIIKVVRAVR